MPTFEHLGATIHYEEFGHGFPILSFAPAGSPSTVEVWSRPAAPINPTTELAADFRVIAMDRRDAGGKSRAPIAVQDGWHTYAADHIALLDHLGIDRGHLYGQCIGGSSKEFLATDTPAAFVNESPAARSEARATFRARRACGRGRCRRCGRGGGSWPRACPRR
jgi:pimeloyl-ACP methyl ester carboxylesterase